MKRYPLLEVCARVDGHRVQREMVREYCRNFDDWNGLLERAEREGMAPLLRKHLLEAGADIPAGVRRSLNLLSTRHQKHAKVRLEVLEEVVRLFQKNRLTPIILKGAALCMTLYPDPALRPMRDMDILLSRDEAEKAQELLKVGGFEESTAPIPHDHHHLPSLHKTVDDVKICFELHRGLYPNITPHYPAVDWEKLLETSSRVRLNETEILVFNHEETLHYLYQHGFRPPLTYESFKLINAADIISYTEKYFSEINWEDMQTRFPDCRHAIPLLHHISPWMLDVIPSDFISDVDLKHRLKPSSYNGWPHKRLSILKAEHSMISILKETFFPPRWWVSVYYGSSGVTGYLLAVFRHHFRQIYLFAKLFRG